MPSFSTNGIRTPPSPIFNEPSGRVGGCAIAAETVSRRSAGPTERNLPGHWLVETRRASEPVDSSKKKTLFVWFIHHLGWTPDRLSSLEDEAAVGSAETEGVGEGVLDGGPAGLVGDVVEVALRVGLLE